MAAWPRRFGECSAGYDRAPWRLMATPWRRWGRPSPLFARPRFDSARPVPEAHLPGSVPSDVKILRIGCGTVRNASAATPMKAAPRPSATHPEYRAPVRSRRPTACRRGVDDVRGYERDHDQSLHVPAEDREQQQRQQAPGHNSQIPLREIQDTRLEPPDRDEGCSHPRHDRQWNGQPHGEDQAVAEPRSTLADIPRAECLGNKRVETQQQPDPDDRQCEKQGAANTNGPRSPRDQADRPY